MEAQKAQKPDDEDLPRSSYLVGKIEILNVEPLDFSEFLQAYDVGLFSFYETISGCKPIPEIFHGKLLDAYSLYLFAGGMPEIVANYLENRDPVSVRKLHRNLNALFEDDIVKYGGEINASKYLSSCVPSFRNLQRTTRNSCTGSCGKTPGHATTRTPLNGWSRREW